MLIGCRDAVVGVESKRYEPYRSAKPSALSDAYWRPVWGVRMRAFERVRDGLAYGSLRFEHLDATQLIKHAFGLWTLAARSEKRATMVYLHREPRSWSDGRPILEGDHGRHRAEVTRFADMISEDEVTFVHLSWSDLLSSWTACDSDEVRRHAAAMTNLYSS